MHLRKYLLEQVRNVHDNDEAARPARSIRAVFDRPIPIE
jgi:hypothetical protein